MDEVKHGHARRRRLTPEGRAVLAAAEAGGVPMFASGRLVRIATENGIEVSPEMTPNEIIERLRQLSDAQR